MRWFCYLWIVPFCLVAATSRVAADGPTDVATVIAPFVEKHCVHCHGVKEAHGDITLHVFQDEASIIKQRKTWTRVLEQLDVEAMPPAKQPRPAAGEIATFVEAVRGVFDRFDRTAEPHPGRVTMRRLSKAEYANTIRDLIGIDVSESSLPPDEVGFGFDNLGDFQTVSAVHMGRYITTAETIMNTAIVIGSPPRSSRIELDGTRFLPPRAPDKPPNPRELFGKGPLYGRFTLPGGPLEGGACKIVLDLKAVEAGDESPRFAILLDGKEVARGVCEPNPKWQPFEFTVDVKVGDHTLGLSLLNEFTAPDNPSKQRGLLLRADSIEVIGPFRPESHAFLLAAPEDLTGEAKSRYVLERFASRAFRRPATKDEVDRLLQIARLAESRTRYTATSAKLREANLPRSVYDKLRGLEDRGSLDEDAFEQSLQRRLDAEELSTHREAILAAVETFPEPWEGTIAFAMQAALCSPKFLFRAEPDLRILGKEPQPLDDFALASRLSYFLWSSMPDQELFDLAAKKQLHQNLPAQVQRMLADSRTKHGLCATFFEQWLGLRLLESARPDPGLFDDDKSAHEWFTEHVRGDMLTETRLFIQAIVKEDRSIFELIDGKFTFLNARLAKHYQIKDTNGNSTRGGMGWSNPPGEPFPRDNEFVRVNLEGTPWGGLLTNGSVLTITSMPTRTSIPKRGSWVLEKILGTPPPPPPANVPELEEEDDENDQVVVSLRQKLERHRTEAACASCHARMDPIGFALENFDALGRFRDNVGKEPIDARGELPGGLQVDGPAGLRAVLRTKKELFARSFTEKMLTYATGRGLEYYDKRAVDLILADLEKNDYRFQSLVIAIVQSDPFRMRSEEKQE